MSGPRAIHYSGGLNYERSDGVTVHMAEGFPVCTSGHRAVRIRYEGRQTRIHAGVTCGQCARLLRFAGKEAAPWGDRHRLCLASDFRDFYDSAFDVDYNQAGFSTWARAARSGWTRRADFRHLAEAGLFPPIPRGGREVFSRDGSEEVVVYEDESAHRGEGKRRCLARDMKPGEFASFYYPFWRLGVETMRHLLIGNQPWTLRYRSDDAWRSNCGNVEIMDEGRGCPPEIRTALARLQVMRRTPLVAVDFLETGRYVCPVALDLNTAPGLSGTPIEAAFTASQVYDLLRERWAEITPDAPRVAP